MNRSTTLEERIEVVDYVRLNSHTYHEAAMAYNLSYQRVRMWVLKAQRGGYKALVYQHRGNNSFSKFEDIASAKRKIYELEKALEDLSGTERVIAKIMSRQQQLSH